MAWCMLDPAPRPNRFKRFGCLSCSRLGLATLWLDLAVRVLSFESTVDRIWVVSKDVSKPEASLVPPLVLSVGLTVSLGAANGAAVPELNANYHKKDR